MNRDPSPPPTSAEVDRIATLPDPVIRNLQITQCYQELSIVMAQRTGLGANWCTFATWASKQAGQTIRKEDLARALRSRLMATATASETDNVVAAAQRIGSRHDAGKIRESIGAVLNPLGAVERASAAVARGNQKVFEEIGREFARFYATCLNDVTLDADKIEQFCAALQPGDPPDGQRYLQQAFNRYYQALLESDAKTRLELLLLANLEIGFHEQTRLQPEIAQALDAAFVDPKEFTRRLLKAIFPYRGWLARLRLFLIRLFAGPTPFDKAINLLLTEARRQARLFITENLMTIGFPHGVRLQLGSDLTAEFPTALRQIANADLLDLLTHIDPTPNDLAETGAIDWADLPERLHFIADMFRCYADCADLLEPPFTPDQIARLKAGYLPDGEL